MRIPQGSAAAFLFLALAVGCSEPGILAPSEPGRPRFNATAALPDVRLSEIHYDNFGTDAGESIEIEGDAGVFLAGWQLVLYNGDGGTVYNATTFSGLIPNHCEGRGVLVLNYATDGIQNGPDGMALVDGTGAVVEFLSYEGSFTATDGPAAGLTSTDIGVFQNSAPVGQSLQRLPDGIWFSGGSTFGACNPDEPPPPARTISFTGRTPADPALPVGFEDQLFATLHEGPLTVPTTFTWSSETPEIASIDPNGVMRALAEGTATFRATALDGTTAIFSLPTRVALASTTAIYEGNAEFGEPADADPADDFILRHVQFTSSYNPIRGIPNWVSYNLEATHFGPEDRCDCFTFDPALPAGFTRYTTADYTGAGAFHGYAIDHGHLARSFDRTSAGLDNAFTFYFSNIIPQAADNNQGPWAALENVLSDFARLQNREVYIIAGASGSKGTVKDEGRITIPAQVWKVALILPRDQGLEDVDDLGDVDLVAVIMPNDPGVRDVPWETYQATVDAIEALSGYDLLALLPDQLEIALESGNRPPVAVADGPYSSSEGATVALSAAGSTDPDEDALTYAWDFGDGTTGSGVNPSHVWGQDGSYEVTLTVTDALGLISSVTTTAMVSNVAPDIAAFAGAILLPWETYSRSGSFADPGADSWSATVNYGDGSGQNPLALNGKSFTLSHVYQQPGGFTVSVRVADDDVSTLRTALVTVWTHAEGIRQSKLLVDQWIASGVTSFGNGNALLSKLDAALKLREEGKVEPCIDHLREVLAVLRDYIRDGRITAANAEPLRVLVNRLITSMSH